MRSPLEPLGTSFWVFWASFFDPREPFWSLFEVVLGALGDHWAVFWAFFRGWGKKEAGLSYRCSLLEAKVSQREPKWIPEGSQNGQKIDQKSIRCSIVVFIALLVAFGPFWMPKWSQRGTKVDAKTDLNTKRPQSAKL